MTTSNDAGRRRSLARAACVGLTLLAAAAGCGGRERASLSRAVRLEIAHEPPLTAPVGQPLLLGLTAEADPPLAPGSAHLWYEAGAGWVRAELEPLPGTDRLEARLPTQPRGRTIRYYFTVRSPLGEIVRLPRGATSEPNGAADSGAASEVLRLAAGVYELTVRAPVAGWASWLRAAGAALALLLILGGAALAARCRPGEPPGRPAGVALEAFGVMVFALALAGAVIVSFQATGSPIHDVPPAWWIAMAAWLPILIVARAVRRPAPGSAPRTRRLALLAAILAAPGAVAFLVGLGRFL